MKLVPLDSNYQRPQTTGFGRIRRPDWLREWVENQGKFARLSCGHIDDLNDKGILPIFKADGKTVVVFCARCDAPATVVKKASVADFLGLKIRKTPVKPPY